MEVQLKAKEMFEKLGYEYECGDKFISCIWTAKNKVYIRKIIFELKNKKFVPYNQVQFTMPLLKAINKQIEELRWDNE